MNKVWLVLGEHPEVPGIPTVAFATKAAANRLAAELAVDIWNTVTRKGRDYAITRPTSRNWESGMDKLAEVAGAAHCWIEVRECEVRS